MSIDCPAGGCDYTGMLDAVEGHVGGKADGLHDGVTIPQVGGSSSLGEGSSEASGTPLWALAGLCLLVVLVVYWAGSENDQPEDQDGPVTEVEEERDSQDPELVGGGLV